jgi:hypothetical protein
MARGSKASRGILQNVRTFNLKKNLSGIVQNKAETFLRPDQAVDIVNMHCEEEGSWTAHNVGYEVVNASGTAYEGGASVDGLAWFVDSTGTNHLFMAINTKLKEINTTSGAASDIDASAGFTAGNPVDFEAMNDTLYTVDGALTSPRKWDGTSAANAAGWPVDDGTNTYSKPKFIEQHQGRMVFLVFNGGTEGGVAATWPSHFIISDLGDPESFTLNVAPPDGAFIGECGPGDGEKIVGAKSMHIPATNESQLVIFKERSIYTVTGASARFSDPDVFKVVKMNGSYGALNNRCIIQVGNDLLALNEFGVTSYSSTTQSGTIQPNTINSDLVKDIIGRLNLSAKEKAWAEHLPHRREVIFWIPTGSSTQCNEAIVYKYPSPGTDELPKWSRRTDAGGKFKCSHGVLLNRTFYIGTYTGFVGEMFAASKYDTVSIPWAYEYPYWDKGNEAQNARIVNAIAQFKVRTGQTATVQTTWKGGGNNDTETKPLELETTVGSAVYGTAVYGTSFYGTEEELKAPFEVFGDGERIKFKFSGNTTDTGPEFLGLRIVMMLGNISQHWN